ncbi:MAG: PP2C family protein-serine/threonine phosphatase [Eubacterium sp.]|nr:PP2C family protein-serine/threonine phosphatase [Eubacterium sp.]
MRVSEKKYRSLRIKAFRVISIGALLLIILITAIGLGIHGYSELKNYHDESRHLMDFAMSMMDMEYLEKIFEETKDIYDSVPEEIRVSPFTEEYEAYFRGLVDDDFFAARNILVNCREKSENRNAFLMFTDPENSALVFVIDGDELDWAYLPGQWLEEDLNIVSRTENSSWRLMMTRSNEYGWIGTDFKKIYASDGSELGYIVMDVDMNDFMNRVFHTLTILAPAAIFLVLVIAYLASRLMKRHILSHLNELASAAKTYIARDKVAQINTESSYFSDLNIRTGDELEDLWSSMTDMEADVSDTMRRLQTITAERERMDAELSIATQIQVGTLPHDFPAFPDRTEFDIFASMMPAKEVGGDFYDFFLIDDDHLAMVIADVSGKGISAALFMVNAKAQLQNQTMASGCNVVEVFDKVNARLIEQNDAMLFVTVWLGILTISTGDVVYVNGGHEYPAIRRNGGMFSVDKDVHCGPLAARKKMKYKSGEFSLKPGDTVFVYTDGVTEANNNERELFGRERLLDALNSEPEADPMKLDENVHKAIAAFVGDASQFDDTTMLCLKYYGK